MKLLIIAGGQGTRLWPLSKPGFPKQLQKLISDKSLLEDTVERWESLIKPANTYLVVADDFQLSAVREQLPLIPPANIIKEPSGKNTAAAVALGMGHILQRSSPAEIVITVWADHFVREPQLLCDRFAQASLYLNEQPNVLIMAGVNPTYPETGYGYIKKGSALKSELFAIELFAEKPPLETAKKYAQDKDYLWNAGMFMWTGAGFVKAITENAPTLLPLITTPQLADSIYPTLQKLSIDEALLEKTHELAVLPLNIDWKDVGHWRAIKEHYGAINEHNIAEGNHLTENSAGNLIINRTGRTIATVGVSNLIIIDTPTELLICHADDAMSVKNIAEKFNNQ